MANKRIRKKQAKMTGKASRFKPTNTFRSDISIKTTEVSPYSQGKLIQSAQRNLSQLSYYFWFKEPIQLENVTKDEVKYLASGKLNARFNQKIEKMMNVDKNFYNNAFYKVQRRGQQQLANYFRNRNVKSVNGFNKAISDLERQVKEVEESYRKSPILRKMIKQGKTPDFWSVVRYAEIEIK